VNLLSCQVILLGQIDHRRFKLKVRFCYERKTERKEGLIDFWIAGDTVLCI
jgi:hypothetical protein